MKIRAADAGNLKRPEIVGKNSTGHAVPKEHLWKEKVFQFCDWLSDENAPVSPPRIFSLSLTRSRELFVANRFSWSIF